SGSPTPRPTRPATAASRRRSNGSPKASSATGSTCEPHVRTLMAIRRVAPALGLFVAAASSVGAQASLPDSVAHRIDAVFARYGQDVPGCEVGVYQNSHIAFEKGYGSANVEYGIPLAPTTPMIMGSVSKQFTAASIALLVQQGRLSLNDDVRKYVPELKDYGKTVTIDHLVHHTS